LPEHSHMQLMLNHAKFQRTVMAAVTSPVHPQSMHETVWPCSVLSVTPLPCIDELHLQLL